MKKLINIDPFVNQVNYTVMFTDICEIYVMEVADIN